MGEAGFTIRAFLGGRIAAVDARSARAFPRHSHDEFGVGVLTGGAQRSWSGRGQVEAGAGDLITVNPGEVHDGEPIGAGRTWSMLYVSPGLVSAMVADLSEGRLAFRELEAPVVRSRCPARLFAAARAALDGGGEEGFEDTLPPLFAALLQAPPQTLPGSERLVRVRERIDDDPAASHALEALAALAGLSRFQTLRGFERLTGLTPHAYVLQRRLDLARRLIRDGSALADAASEAGFFDQSHLNRLFVARYGMTPGAYAAAFAA